VSIFSLIIASEFAKNRSASGGATSPAGARWAESGSGDTIYQAGTSNAQMAPQTLGNSHGGQAHENRQPFLALNDVIALIGIFPSRS
jgi:microcystin-dependent protein